ncbi:TetR family transcriptional regulator [Actinomadura viridis]|uniref:AcrR family transcriptional regulator n=1 Tax=Actinomadura viridis TaxID=58110 RepID=A0A931DKE2_9ACTN|nr:TetR family transcriptional regulator [Actinomadura viridis]MBG6091630.1 AcrR family transcriptional regulator [Actinomadura viridis]
MSAAAPAGRDLPHAPERGRRERKKHRTRMALLDAALDLFLEQGYDATTIDEIVAAVPVSQRTFFRYFATKEDLVTGFKAEHDQIMREALAARPDGERPFVALAAALGAVLRAIAEDDPDGAARFRKVRRVIEANPALMPAQIARMAATERALAALIARRQGVDPDTDVRPRLIVALHTAATRVAFEDCARNDVWDPVLIAARVEETLALARDSLPEWV